MKRVIVNKKIPFAIKAQFGIPLFALLIALVIVNLYFLPFLLLTIMFMFSSYLYEFNENFNHKIKIKVFGFSLLSLNKSFIKPDYISLFNQPLKSSWEFGVSKHKVFTIKFFNGNINETILRSSNKSEVLRLGHALSLMFNIELYNTLE